MLEKYKTILWDFDGVILDSNIIRTKGFIEIFKDFPNNYITQLIKYHEEMGGLSRYHKIEYFFNKIVNLHWIGSQDFRISMNSRQRLVLLPL